MNYAIIIPAFEPDEKLLHLVYELIKMPFPHIFVINDGSSKKCENIFKEIKQIEKCTVIHHSKNQGKGAALKTGMQLILEKDGLYEGCITVDADGQHLPEDIWQVAVAAATSLNCLVLGSRDFNQDDVPTKSRLGNLITRKVVGVLTGTTVEDTQTGLRGIPLELMKACMNISGERYEFEMNMLMEAPRIGFFIREIPIQTVYIDENSTSHFHPWKDSFKIYKEIFKFCFSSLLCEFIDIGVFALACSLLPFSATQSLLWATLMGRMVSSVVNFNLNRTLVFENRESILVQAAKYYSLCILQTLCSWMLLNGLNTIGFSNMLIGKIIVDGFLFVISFLIQRVFIFRRRGISHEKAV